MHSLTATRLIAYVGLLSCLCLGTVCAQRVTSFSQIIVFGDSFSDTGNVAATAEDRFGLRYPGNDFNYADGRFTNDTGTAPAAKKYTGVWHEQLARLFLGIFPARASLNGGLDYAFGDAETADGQRTVDVAPGVEIKIDNLGQQVTGYLAGHVADPGALYIVWAGSNDLFADHSYENALAAADRELEVVRRLVEAGAANILLPNVPPLGLTPAYSGDAATSAALTEAASEFRDELASGLNTLEIALAAEGLTPRIYLLDVFDLFNRLTAGAGVNYGFTNVTGSTQDESVKPDQALFWDDVHPTTYGHFQLAAEAYTLLTGTPVVEVFPTIKTLARNGGTIGSFLLTRTGIDLRQTLTVTYTAGGTATPGADYVALKGQKKIKAGKRTVKVNVAPTPAVSGAAGVKVKLILQPADGYALPVVQAGGINLTSF